MRMLIRKSMNRLEPIPIKQQHIRNIPSDNIIHKRNITDTINRNKQQKIGSFKPCLAMHVRHGDLYMDSRGGVKLDRGLHNYMHNIHNLTKSLGNF